MSYKNEKEAEKGARALLASVKQSKGEKELRKGDVMRYVIREGAITLTRATAFLFGSFCSHERDARRRAGVILSRMEDEKLLSRVSNGVFQPGAAL